MKFSQFMVGIFMLYCLKLCLYHKQFNSRAVYFQKQQIFYETMLQYNVKHEITWFACL